MSNQRRRHHTGAVRPDPQRVAAIARFPLSRAALPSSVSLQSKFLPVRDQGSTSECVAYAFCAAKEVQDDVEAYLSPDYLYSLRNPSGVNGMSGLDACTILENPGTCVEWIYQQSGVTPAQISASCGKHRIKSYASLLGTTVEMQTALAAGNVCPISLPYYDDASSDNQFWVPGSSGEQTSEGHCVAVCGYDNSTQLFTFRNSWGTSWGNSGYGQISYSDFLKYAWEAYSFVDESTVPTPEPDPSPPSPQSSGCC